MAQDSSKALTTTTAQRGVVAGGAVEFNLDNFPTDHFNRLVPTQTLMTTDLLAPVVQVVQLDVERDTYKSPDVPEGNRALGRVALRKLVTAAGISILDNRRTDDGRDPDVCEMTATAEMILPTGQRIRATGVKRIDMKAQKFSSDAHRAKFRSFFQEHVSSRAENRAIRALLSLQASYPIRDLQKPFAVVSFVPNTANPEVRAAMLQAMAPSVAALYGPDQAKQLAAGEQVTQVPPAPDDDVVDGTCTDAPAAGSEPDWFGGETAAKPEASHKLERILREQVATLGLGDEPASEEQRNNLKALLKPFGYESVMAVLSRVFGLEAMPDITKSQAAAIFVAARESDFEALWKELAAIEKAKAA